MTTYIGIDVSKDSLSVAVPKSNAGWNVNEYTNSPDGIRTLIGQLPDQAHCVLEATAGPPVRLLLGPGHLHVDSIGCDHLGH